MIHLLWCTIRPEVFKQMHPYWIGRSTNTKNIKTHIAVNVEQHSDYIKEYFKSNSLDYRIMTVKTDKIGVCYPSYQLSSTTEGQTGDIVVFASDDFLPPQNWDQYLISKLEGKEGGLMVRDGYQLPDSSNMQYPAITIPIMTWGCFEKLNKTIYNPSFFETEKKADFIESPAEDADLTQYKDHFDIVFSSPPYFNVERYSYDDTQSWVRYKNIDAWNKEFLHKTIANVWPTLKKGGILAVNIADVYASSKGDGKGYKEICNPMNDFIKTLGAEYEGCLGMEMAKRPGSAGAASIIVGDEERYSEEALKKAEEAGDKTFCEPIWIWKKL